MSSKVNSPLGGAFGPIAKTETPALDIIDGLVKALEKSVIDNTPAPKLILVQVLTNLRVQVQELVTLCDERLREIERTATGAQKEEHRGRR